MRGFAERLKGLIEDQDDGDVAAAARRLELEDAQLVAILYGPPQRPGMRLFRAVVREYVADPGWLLTGLYDISELARDHEEFGEIVELLFRYTEGADTPPDEHPPLDLGECAAGRDGARAAPPPDTLPEA